MAIPFDAFQRLAPPLRDEDKPRLLARLQAQFDDETDEIAAAAWAMGARAFCNAALGRHICRVCGCWDLQACEGGCAWVEPGLCSKCGSDPAAESPSGAGEASTANHERSTEMSDKSASKEMYPPARWAAEQVESFTASFFEGAAFSVLTAQDEDSLTLTLRRAPKCDVAAPAPSRDAAPSAPTPNGRFAACKPRCG